MSLYQSYICYQNSDYLNNYQNDQKQELTYQHQAPSAYTEIIQQETKRGKYSHNCEICGDTCSGFHYGAFTCEACKLFFSRVTRNKRKRKFDECMLKNCVIDIQSRSDCPECRFKKCLNKGMSLANSRYGRNIIFKNTPKPIQNSENPSLKLTELFNQTQQLFQSYFYYLTYENSYQTEYCLRTSLISLYDKSINLIDHKTITYKSEFKFLQSYSNINFSKLNETKLNALVLLFSLLFNVNFKHSLNFVFYTTQVKTELFNMLLKSNFNDVLTIYLDKMNSVIDNLSSNSAFLINIYYFLHVFMTLGQLDQVEQIGKYDNKLVQMIKNELTLNKFVAKSNELKISKTDECEPIITILNISTQTSNFIDSISC
ncbi:unnamed protein product [Brachionus calyciflorus]|uniref:Nuclear receptor domain-containing protein n=1 Tax=Brachionus calyciflorus TaxID=104777 RepID=A0A814DB61_9BILA|nr:unnamed protein product [Brachionus calyciflorus]